MPSISLWNAAPHADNDIEIEVLILVTRNDGRGAKITALQIAEHPKWHLVEAKHDAS